MKTNAGYGENNDVDNLIERRERKWERMSG